VTRLTVKKGEMFRLFKNGELQGTKKIQTRSVFCIRKSLDFKQYYSKLPF